jgi:hypothetical protein
MLVLYSGDRDIISTDDHITFFISKVKIGFLGT